MSESERTWQKTEGGIRYNIYLKKEEKCEVQPIHCWGSASASEASQNNLWKTTFTRPKQHAMPFFFILRWAKNTHNRLSRKTLIWCIEVFTVVQYGDQMCIMYVHNHELGDLFSFCWMNFLHLSVASYLPLHRGKCKTYVVLFQRVVNLPKSHLFFFYFAAYSCHHCAWWACRPLLRHFVAKATWRKFLNLTFTLLLDSFFLMYAPFYCCFPLI